MAEPFSHIESGTIDASTKLDKEKNVKDFIRSPSSQIDSRKTKGISLIKNPKRGRKTDYSDNRSKVDLCNKPHVSLSDISVLSSSKRSCKKLDLSGCGLTKLPEGVCDYYRLEELNLSNNPLSNLDISSFKYLPLYTLKKLDLSGCGLTKLPKGLCDHHELEELNLSNNPLSNLDISSLKYLLPYELKKLNLSGCGLAKLPDLKECSNLQELNFSNNSFDHQDLLEKLNSKMVFSCSGFHQSGKELLEPTASGLGLSKRTCRIIFEDAVYIRNSGVWTVAHKDVASTEEIYKRQMELEELNRFSGLSLPNKELWLDEFCQIRKYKNLTIESYYAMLESLTIVCNLVSNTVDNYLERVSTLSLSRCCDEILDRFIIRNSASQCVQERIDYLKSAVWWLKDWSIHVGYGNYILRQSITTSEMALKEALGDFSKESCIADKVLAAEQIIISTILSNLTKPEAAVLRCLQSLQELHDLDTIRKVFSFLETGETKTTSSEQVQESVEIAKSVVKINKILFEFVGIFFKPPPTVKEWPATIQLDEQVYNPLTDGRQFGDRLIDTGVAVSGSVNLDIGEDDNKDKDPITDATEYSVLIVKSNGETADNSITVDQTGGWFSLPEVSAFLLFPPNAVDETVTLKCSRVKHKECEVKPRDGEVFVSRILKVEPEGLTFKKPVTLLLSHSLDEDQVFLYFYELFVENLSPTGCQELKTERISSIEGIDNLNNVIRINQFAKLSI